MRTQHHCRPTSRSKGRPDGRPLALTLGKEMELRYKLSWFKHKRPITIECSDGESYICKCQTFPHRAFWIYKNEKEILSGLSQYKDIWQVRDSEENRILFTTGNDWGKFSIIVEEREVKEKEFSEVFGWKPFSMYGLACKWGFSFPKKENYLIELAYGYLMFGWKSD